MSENLPMRNSVYFVPNINISEIHICKLSVSFNQVELHHKQIKVWLLIAD